MNKIKVYLIIKGNILSRFNISGLKHDFFLYKVVVSPHIYCERYGYFDLFNTNGATGSYCRHLRGR